jgi:acyl-CoA synthetase (AMP-forming)/AMP-acid ligase II
MSLKLSHWYGLCMGITGWLYHGNTFYLQESFDAEASLMALASGDISLFSHTPYAYAKMLEVEGDYDLSGVRLCISGSAPLPPDTWTRFKERFGTEIVECYGSSETGRIAANSLAHPASGTPGKLLSGVETRFSEENELLVKSPGLFPGYFLNTEATRENLDRDGYWNTGDIAELRDEYLFLKGRRQETIRKMGYTISPRDIEWALLKADGVVECAVVGQATAGGDDKIVYFIAGRITEEELKSYASANLPSVWRPDRVVMLEKLPRSPAGKVLLPELRGML